MIAASAQTLAVGCYVQFQEPPTKVFWQTAGREPGTAVLLHGTVLHCDTVLFCCRLLLYSCRRHLAAGRLCVTSTTLDSVCVFGYVSKVRHKFSVLLIGQTREKLVSRLR